jgi:DNA-entry nuclease
MNMKKIIHTLLALPLCFSLLSCSGQTAGAQPEQTADNTAVPLSDSAVFDYEKLPEYQGQPYIEVNDNHPYDPSADVLEFIHVGEQDALGRCTEVEAVIGPDTLPDTKRGPIGGIRPTGWHTVRYDDLIDGNYLYNRCHLIAYEISGINADEAVLVTGTRYMNVEGMLPFENKIAGYIRSTGNHVWYHAVPVFAGDELVCRGVLLEAASIEADDLEFCVFCYNVQPGVTINYATGDSERTEQAVSRTVPSQQQDYILNTNTKRFHYPDCDSVKVMKDKNKKEVYSSRKELIEDGYTPCAVCNP